MARYIDVDALIEELDKREYSREKHDFKILIDKQPTAYDVEAVVAELEEDTTCRVRLDGYIPKSKAIEIVRKGGMK